MPIFDKELNDNVSDRDPKLPEMILQSPAKREIDTRMLTATPPDVGNPGLTMDQLSKISLPNLFTSDSPFQMVPRSELLDNQRYALYSRGSDLENIYGLQQGWMSQLANGIVKMGAKGLGAFAQSFATLPNTISAIKNKDISKLSGEDDGYESGIDRWVRNVDNYFPNYATRKEREHPYLAMIPGFAGSANFWGDGVISNLGYMAGAIAGAAAQDAIVAGVTGGIGEIPLVASQIGKASLWLNKLFTGTNRVDEVLDLAASLGKTEKQILNIKKLGELAAADRVMSGARYGMITYSSARTESAIESRDGYRQVKEELIRQYKLENLGADPTPEALQEIEGYATDAMNTRFGINMALLTVSNAIQFDNLFRSFTTSSKALTSGFTKYVEDAGKIGLKEASIDEFEKKGAKTIIGKGWDFVKPTIPNIFTEGVYEEGGQFAAERGTYDYYTRKYKNLKDPKNKENWDTLNEVINSTTSGLADQFGRTEGIQNMLIGAISAVIARGAMGRIDKIRGGGKEARIQHAINSLNEYGLTGTLSGNYSDTLQSAAIAKEMEEASKSGNVYKYKNLQGDLFFDFIKSGVNIGMHDVRIEQLNMLKDIPKEDFEKTFGMKFEESNKKTVSEYVDSLINDANRIKKTIDSIDKTFKNPYKNVINPTTDEDTVEAFNHHTFNNWKTDLARYASIAPEVNSRLDSIQKSVSSINPLIDNNLLGALTKRDSLKELSDIYEEKANQLGKTITEFTSPEEKRKIKAQIKALRTISERINLAINNKAFDEKTFENILNFELNGRELGDKVVPSEEIVNLFEYGVDINRNIDKKNAASRIFDQLSSKEGFDKYFQQAEEMASEEAPEPTAPEEESKEEVQEAVVVPQFTNKAGEKETPQLEREYELPTKKVAKVRKIADDRFKVTAPNGDVTFYPTREKAKEAADEMNADMADLAKVKILTINPDGTIKVEDLAGNIQNISPEAMAGYEKIQTEQEKLAKDKEQLDKQQKAIEEKSGDVATGVPTEDAKIIESSEEESKRRDAKLLFISGITESEDWADPTQSAPHIKRSREFLNKVGYMPNRANLRAILLTPKQIEGLGLAGLVQLSYGVDASKPVDSISGATDPEMGFVAQIFTEQVGDKLFYVDKNGKRLSQVGQPVDLQEIIFQTMPTTSLFYNIKDKQGNPVPRYRSNQKEEAEAYSKAWEKLRKQMFEADSTQYSVYKFSVSRGIANIETVNGQRAKNHVGGILISENKIGSTEGLIVIPTKGFVTDNNGNSITFPNGTPVIKAGDNIEFLQNAKLSNNQIDTIYTILKALGEDILKQSKSGKPIEPNSAYTTYLQNILFWKIEGKASPNKIFIDTTNMTFVVGNKSFDLTKIGEIEKDVKEQLGKAYHSVNNKTLDKNFNAKFYEYYIDKDGKLAEREWKNYQTYLLAAKYPDGTARSGETTPLTTGIARPTDILPYTHKQKYATLQTQLTVETAPAAEVKAAPITKIGDFTVGQENTITLKEPIGEVKFTPTVVDGTVSVEAASSDKIKTLAADPEKSAPYINYLKDNNLFEADKTTEENLVKFISLNISGRLQSMLPKEAPKAATFTPTTPYGTPTGPEVVTAAPVSEEVRPMAPPEVVAEQELKAKRADIERRRKEELNKIPNVRLPINAISAVRNKKKDVVTGKDWEDANQEEVNKLQKEYDEYVQQGVYTTKGMVFKHLNEAKEALSKVKEINAKYDAELDALEGAKPAETDDVKFKNIIRSIFEIKEGNMVRPDYLKPENVEIYEDSEGYGHILKININGIDHIAIMPELQNLRFDSLERLSQFDNSGLQKVSDEEKNKILKGYNDIFDLEIRDIVNEKFGKDAAKFVMDYLKNNKNAKKEILALEGTKPAEAKPKGPIEPSNPQGPSDNFRRVGIGGKEMMTDAELQLFKQWHADNVPGIPYEVLENMINVNRTEKAWGVFEDGVAKFVRGGLRGTEYHEIFEGIWAGFLSPEQRAAIMTELRESGKDFIDRETGKKLNYATATDKQIKERIADDFSDYRLGKLPARSLGERIRRFFKMIMDFFKSFVTKPSMKEQLFKAIDAGKFKEAKLSESAKSMPPQYRRRGSLTQKQTHEFVQDMTARTAGILFKEAKKGSLFSPDRITDAEVFDKIAQSYNTELIDTTNKITKMEFIGSDETWKQLISDTKDSLRVLGIEFDEEGQVNINDENYDNRLYAPEPFTTNWKKSSPGAIKFVISTLLEVNATNQENSLSMVLPQIKPTSIGGYKLVDFGRTFAALMDKLANTNKVSKAMEKLIDLASYDAKYVRLFQRIGGDLTNKIIPFEQFNNDDWRLFIQFMQTFTKQKPTALIQYKSGTEVYTQPADIYTAAKEQQSQWINNMRSLAKDKTSAITFNADKKMYEVDRSKINSLPIRTPEDKIKFLNAIGVRFELSDYLKLKERDIKKFADQVEALKTYFGESGDVYSITSKTLKINGPTSILAGLYIKVNNPSQDSTRPNVEGERVNNFADNNVPSFFTNDFNETDTVDDLKKERTELNDVFSTNSQVLKKGGLFYDEDGNKIADLKLMTIEGTLDEEKNRGTKTSKLKLASRFVQEINQNLKGNYYVLIPGDAATEFMMNLGNNIEFSDVQSGRAWAKTYKIFKGYLMDDIALAMDFKKRQHNLNVAPRAKELRFFNDILSDVKEGKLVPSKVLEDINNMIVSGDPVVDIEEYVNKNIDTINNYIKAYIEEIVADTKSTLRSNQKIVQIDENTFMYSELDDSFANDNGIKKFRMSDDMVNNLLTFNRINAVISNIEYHKILFGDPFQFSTEKGKLDETKRIKSFLSPRRTTFDNPIFNNLLNDVYNKAGDIELTVDDPGYHEHKPFLNTVTLADVNLVTPLMGKVNEADAASWLMDGAYREIKLKNSQWSPEAEKWHQWQMAYTRQHMPGYIYTNKALEKQDIETISKPEPKFVTEVLKPIATGNKYGKNQFDLVLDKFSQMPVYYKMAEGTNLEKLYIKMFNENIDYVIMESGRKVGSEGTHSVYIDGEFNNAPFNNLVQVPFDIYGIQVENSFEGPKSQTRGSQPMKIVTMDMFENGEPINEAVAKEYERYTDIINKLHQNAAKDLLNRLGIKYNGDGTFSPMEGNGTIISKTLMTELLRRELSDNAKDTLQLDENGEFPIPFEASPAYVQIRNILYSMINKAVVSPKMNGRSSVQVPVTMFEKLGKNRSLALKTERGEWMKITPEQYKNLPEDQKKDVVITDDTLKFYTEKHPYCEIMLPHWFGEKLRKGRFKTDEAILKHLNTPEGRKILTGIGFRIPTQAMSSIEVFRVKGFLPESMGNTVIVPSEITTKAGSDFDIDKLNLYLKSVYIDSDGNIRLVNYLGSEEATKQFFGEVFDRKLQRNKMSKGEIREANDIRTYGLDDPKGLVEKYSDILDSMLEEVKDGTDVSHYLDKELEKLEDANFQAVMKERFVNDMYKRSLENEYYDSMEKLLTMPENFKALITPVDDGGLKEFASKMRKLKGVDESKIKNRILNPNFLTRLRNAFVTGKRWVGIVAVNITNHSLAQKAKVYIDAKKISMLPMADRKILKDGSVLLPHNTIMVDGQPMVSLSGKMTADGSKQLISNRLSGHATAVVDISKDPFIMDLITSDLVIGTTMFLERIGAGKTGLLFLNQPIVIEYLKMLDNKGINYLFDEKTILATKILFSDTTSDLVRSVGVDVSNSNLEGNISEYGAKKKLTPAKNAEQQNILDEFLKYGKMAEFNFKFTQALNYDTTKFRSGDTLFKKQTRTADALSGNIISSVKDVMDATYLGEQAEILDLLSEAMGEIMVLDKPVFTDITEKVLKPYAQKEFMSQDDYERIGNKIRASFLDYIIQTKTGFNDRIKELLVDVGTSVSSKLALAKHKYPGISILNDLVITSSDRVDGAQSIKLRAKLDTAYDENMYTDMMRELRDNPGTTDLYNDIIILSILQGTYQSKISIGNIIPIEDYSRIVAPIISGLTNDADIEAFANGSFQRNNFRDDTIMPQVTPYFDVNYGTLVGEKTNQFGDHVADIYQYYSPSFPGIEAFGIQAKDRRVLLLTEKFNPKSIWSDFVKFPRVITTKDGEMIDVTTGRTITKQDFAERKQKGDNSLNDVFGYKRVRLATGEPLTTVDAQGNIQHVYKLINLYGESPFTSEYYTYPKMSALNNGTVQIDNEIPDSDLIEYYSPGAVASDFQQAPTEPTTFDELTEFPDERKQEILSNFAGKHKMSVEEAKNYINEALQKDRQNVINKLKECY